MTSSEETLPVRFGPFLLLHVLGAGGMGKAYLGRHPDWEGRLVIKRMHAHFLEDQTIFKRFVHEAEVATYVRHSNIAQLVAMGTVGTEPFFATEHVFGVPISHLVHRLELGQTKPMPIGVALKIAIGLARGVEGIHDARDVDTGESLNLIHRDIGARNVLLGFDGRPVIIDLGLGKSILADWQTAANVFAGSPDYMPPEQALGKRVDRRADVYAAAVTIWELVAGRKRIDEAHVPQRSAAAIDAQPEPLLEYRPDAPKGLERLLQHAMAPDPEQRTATATVLREGLEREWARISPRVQTSHVEDWLEASCATVIAKERRGLEESEALDYDFDVDHTDAQTQILAAQPIMFMPPSPPREPSRGDEPAPAPILVAADSAKDVGVRAISKLREVAMQLLDSYIKLPRRERHIVSAGLAPLIVALIVVAGRRPPPAGHRAPAGPASARALRCRAPRACNRDCAGGADGGRRGRWRVSLGGDEGQAPAPSTPPVAGGGSRAQAAPRRSSSPPEAPALRRVVAEGADADRHEAQPGPDHRVARPDRSAYHRDGGRRLTLFMIIERFKAGDAKPVYERFDASGRLMPDGLEYVESWVTADLAACYQVVRGERVDVNLWIEAWRDLVDFEVIEVVKSRDARHRVIDAPDAG